MKINELREIQLSGELKLIDARRLIKGADSLKMAEKLCGSMVVAVLDEENVLYQVPLQDLINFCKEKFGES